MRSEVVSTKRIPERQVWYGSQGPQHLLRNGTTVGVQPACRSEGNVRVADESREIVSETRGRRLVGSRWKPCTSFVKRIWLTLPQQVHVVVERCALGNCRGFASPWHVGMPTKSARTDAWVKGNLYPHEAPLLLTDGSASRSPCSPILGSLYACYRAFNDYVTLVFSERGHVAKHKLSCGCAGVYALSEAFKMDAPAFQLQSEGGYLSGVTAKAVELPNHKGITAPKILERLLELLPGERLAGLILAEKVRRHYAVIKQRINLQIGALFLSGYTRIANKARIWFVLQNQKPITKPNIKNCFDIIFSHLLSPFVVRKAA